MARADIKPDNAVRANIPMGPERPNVTWSASNSVTQSVAIEGRRIFFALGIVHAGLKMFSIRGGQGLGKKEIYEVSRKKMKSNCMWDCKNNGGKRILAERKCKELCRKFLHSFLQFFSGRRYLFLVERNCKKLWRTMENWKELDKSFQKEIVRNYEEVFDIVSWKENFHIVSYSSFLEDITYFEWK